MIAPLPEAVLFGDLFRLARPLLKQTLTNVLDRLTKKSVQDDPEKAPDKDGQQPQKAARARNADLSMNPNDGRDHKPDDRRDQTPTDDVANDWSLCHVRGAAERQN